MNVATWPSWAVMMRPTCGGRAKIKNVVRYSLDAGRVVWHMGEMADEAEAPIIEINQVPACSGSVHTHQPEAPRRICEPARIWSTAPNPLNNQGGASARVLASGALRRIASIIEVAHLGAGSHLEHCGESC